MVKNELIKMNLTHKGKQAQVALGAFCGTKF